MVVYLYQFLKLDTLSWGVDTFCSSGRDTLNVFIYQVWYVRSYDRYEVCMYNKYRTHTHAYYELYPDQLDLAC